MNKQRRKALGALSRALDEVKARLEEQLQAATNVRDEEQDVFDNKPESLQTDEASERIDKLDSMVDELEAAMQSISDAVNYADEAAE